MLGVKQREGWLRRWRQHQNFEPNCIGAFERRQAARAHLLMSPRVICMRSDKRLNPTRTTRYPNVCSVMRQEQRPGIDEVISAKASDGPNFAIRYRLPR